MDEEHHQKNDSSIILRTSVPFVEIDSLFIDLSSCMDKPDAGDCDHFSIRGYASQMREKDWKKCWPFNLDGDYDQSEETISLLPPFHVPQFRWWRCQNCRKETPAGFGEKSNLDMPDARKAVASTSTNLCNLEHPPSFSTDLKEKKAEGDEVDFRWILNPEIPIASVAPEVESNLMLELNKSDPEHRESAENCKLLCGNEVAEVELGLRNLKVIDENPEVFDDEKQISAHNEETEITIPLSGVKIINQGCNGNSDSAELDESNVIPVHTEISAENDTRDHHSDKWGSLHRRKARKVRLLAELLNENEIIKTNHIDREESSSRGTSEKSEGLKEFSAPLCPVDAKKNVRCSGQNLKSKLPLDEDRIAADTSSNVNNKIQVLKGDVETTDLFHANESENGLIVTGLRTKKNLSNKYMNDVKSIHGKKKNRKIQLNACSSLNIPPGSGDNMSETSFKPNEFSGRAMDPFLLFGSRIEPISSLSKRKSKMPITDDRQGFNWSNTMPRRDSVSKEVEIRNNEPVVVSSPSVPNESSRGLHLSLTSYTATARNDKKSVFETQDGSRSFLSWQGSTSTASVVRNKSDAKSKKHKDSNFPFNYLDTFSEQGGHCGVNSKKTSGSMHFPNGKQYSNSQVYDTSWSHLQGNSRVNKVEKGITVQEHLVAQTKQSEHTVGKISEQGVIDDIPMEIVELMAKNQYERCLDDSTVSSKSQPKTSSKNAQIMNFSNACGRSGSVQEKTNHKWKPQVRNGKNVGYGKQSSGNYFSHTERGHFNIDHLRQTLMPREYATFGHSQNKSSNAVNFLASSTVENACPQYSHYSRGLRDQEPSHSRVQSFSAYNSRQPVSQKNVDVAHLWTQPLPNDHPYVPRTTPKKVASQSTIVNAITSYPESSSKGAMNREHNPKLFNPKVTNLEKGDGNYGLENFRTNAKHPFHCHSNGIELPRNLMGSLDLYSNETMSAMHLLSLMDAGMQRSETHENPRFPKKPFPHDLKKVKDVPRMDIGLHRTFDSISYSSDYYTEIHPSKKSRDCFPPASVGGVSISPSIGHESCEVVSDLTGKAALQCTQKEITKCSTSTWNNVPKSQKSVFTSGSLRSHEGVLPIHSLQKKSVDLSSSSLSMSGYHRVENPGQCITECHGTKKILEHLKVSSEFGICSINKNPAEFSVPDAGNVYMIGAEDLQFSKRISPEKIHGLNNMDGRKRKRNVKHTVVKQHALHYSTSDNRHENHPAGL